MGVWLRANCWKWKSGGLCIAIAPRSCFPKQGLARAYRRIARPSRCRGPGPAFETILGSGGGPLGGALGTLDAIHLVTAMLWSEYNGEDIVFLTHDRQLANAARACGLTVYPDSVRHAAGL